MPGAFPVSCHSDVKCVPGFKLFNWVMGFIWEDCSYLATALMFQQAKQLVLSQPQSGCVWYPHTSLSVSVFLCVFIIKEIFRKTALLLYKSSSLCICESTLHKMISALANKCASQKMILFIFAVSSTWNMQYLIEGVWVYEEGMMKRKFRGAWRTPPQQGCSGLFSIVLTVLCTIHKICYLKWNHPSL